MLRARLLGALEVELDGATIDSPASQRPWVVFAYLALAARPVPRGELASTFWPDVLDRSARASLRSALWALRKQLGDALCVEDERVALSSELWTDLAEFERLAASRAPERALELCRGELLEGIEEDWAHAARERQREREIELLEKLACAAEKRGSSADAVAYTRRQAERDRFDEAAHRRLISRLAVAGDRAGAMRTYRMLAGRLRRELGVAPSAVTRELVDGLQADPDAHPSSPAAPPLVPAGLLALVGRDAELAQLERAWRAASAGTGTAAVIRGEAGIGKTRLATELRLRAGAEGARTAESAALDLGGAAPLSLWAELIRGLLPWLPAPGSQAVWPDELAALAAELPAHFGRDPVSVAPVAPDLQRTRLFEAVVALLEWAARDRPLLLVLEDVHGADEASLELTAYAARRLAGLRVLVLLTRRELPHSPAADRLEHALRGRGLLTCELDLVPLAREPIAALARQAAALGEHDLRRVVDGAEGNALLAVETARALARGLDEVAPSLRGSVRAALAPLSDDVRTLVELAAVAGRPVEASELGCLPVRDPDQAAAGALQTGMVLAKASGIGFRHALLREAVYHEIPEPRRPGLHQRWAAALLEAERLGAAPRPAEVARHLRLAGADGEAVPELIRAAAQARAVAALDHAVGYLEEALAIDPGRADAWLERGELEAWRGRREPAEAAFARALELLRGGETGPLAQALLRRARAYHGPICVPRAVLASAREALELLGPEAVEERSEALAAAAWAEASAGSVEEAERLLEQLSHEAPASDDLRIYDAGHARALALMRRGRFVESYAPSIAAGEAVARAGRPDLAYGCWANVASAAAAGGEAERALEFLERGMEAVSGHGLRGIEVHLLAERSFVLRGMDRLEEAAAAAEAEQELAERLGQPELAAMASHDRGMVALEAGEAQRAASLLEASLVEGAPISRPLTRLALAEALARSGEPDRAAEHVRAAVLEPVRASDFPDALVPRLARVQGLIADARDQPEEARRRLEEAVGGWERLLARTVRADTITTALADLGRPVVGLVEPERELARARADLLRLVSRVDAVVP